MVRGCRLDDRAMFSQTWTTATLQSLPDGLLVDLSIAEILPLCLLQHSKSPTKYFKSPEQAVSPRGSSVGR